MNLDYSALTRELSPEKRERSTKGKRINFLATYGGYVVGACIVVIFAVNLVLALQDIRGWLLAIGAIILGAIAIITVLASDRRAASLRRRLALFAAENNGVYQYGYYPADKAGMIFTTGHSQTILDSIKFNNGIEVGNMRYVIGAGKTQQTYVWGYTIVTLKRHLPHMVLDARSNNYFGAVSNLPHSLAGHRTLKLEGDFSDKFLLHVPEGYERDAYYIFTPDVMAALVDNAENYDIEVIDNKVIIFSREQIPLHDEQAFDRRIKIADAIGEEIVDQGDYYADERVANRSYDIVAEPGRRLKQKTRIGLIIAFVIIIIVATLDSLR
jgi:hypothetical protein